MTIRRSRLLLVEDDVLVRITVAMMLEDEGFRVIEAGSAAEAWKLINGGLEIEAVVTDVNLGHGPTGIQMVEGMRDVLPEVAIIFITGRPASMAGRRLGPREAVLTKPFQGSDISETIRALVTH